MLDAAIRMMRQSIQEPGVRKKGANTHNCDILSMLLGMRILLLPMILVSSIFRPPSDKSRSSACVWTSCSCMEASVLPGMVRWLSSFALGSVAARTRMLSQPRNAEPSSDKIVPYPWWR